MLLGYDVTSYLNISRIQYNYKQSKLILLNTLRLNILLYNMKKSCKLLLFWIRHHTTEHMKMSICNVLNNIFRILTCS